jgi:hypothetical protein
MTTTNPLALAAEAKSLASKLVISLDALLVQLNSPSVSDGSATKKSDGRLLDHGIDALYADFAAKTLTNEQLAKVHDISLSGVVKRKAMWKKGRR